MSRHSVCSFAEFFISYYLYVVFRAVPAVTDVVAFWAPKLIASLSLRLSVLLCVLFSLANL